MVHKAIISVACQMIYRTRAYDIKAVVERSEHTLVSLVISTETMLIILECETRVANP